MFCRNCGNKNDDNAVFCTECGTRVNPESLENSVPKVEIKVKEGRNTTYEGELHKCPSCGEVLKSFETVCSACNHEIRSSKGSLALEIFSRELQTFEANRTNKGAIKSYIEQLGIGSIDKVDMQIINLIKNYNVPNNIEDLSEFLILACSNINDTEDLSVRLGANIGRSMAEIKLLAAINDAWISKASQVYQKALLSSKDNSKFTIIESIYLEKLRAVKEMKAKSIKKRKLTIFLIILFFVIFFAFAFYMSILEAQGII